MNHLSDNYVDKHRSRPKAASRYKQKTAPEGAAFVYLLNRYYFFLLAIPINAIRPEPNSQAAAGTETGFTDDHTAHVELALFPDDDGNPSPSKLVINVLPSPYGQCVLPPLGATHITTTLFILLQFS
jgi:hypothetical protein